MEAIMMPVIVLGITGILMGLFLAYASKKFEVQVDPKVEAIMAILPGVNCGGCGYPGCTGYAMGVVEEGVSMTLCAPGGPKVAQAIGDIMGVAVEVPVKKKPEKKKPAPKPSVAASSAPAITATKEFIEKNKKSLNSFKEAFDAKDEEKMQKLIDLATKVKKEELLKYYDEIKAGRVIPDPNAPVAGETLPTITATKEFIEKNKKSLNSFKEAFDTKDEEKMQKLIDLATKVKKEELLKYYDEIKAGKIVPDPATMSDVTSAETKVDEKVVKNAEENKEKIEKKEATTLSDKEKEEQAANYCSVLGDGLCVPEQNEKIIQAGVLKEVLEQPEVKTKKELSPEEKLKEKEAENYCSVLGDGLCVPEQNEEIAKTLEKEIK